jgi:uncharacterized protein (UPF0335 family)
MSDTTNTFNVRGVQLKSLVEGYELLERQKGELEADIATLLAEVRAAGYDVRAFKAFVKLRKADGGARSELDELVRLYGAAVGAVDAGDRALAASEAGA